MTPPKPKTLAEVLPGQDERLKYLYQTGLISLDKLPLHLRRMFTAPERTELPFENVFSPIYRETDLVPEQIQQQFATWQTNYNNKLLELQTSLSGLVYQNDSQYISNINDIRRLEQTMPQGSDYQNDPTYISNANEIRRLEQTMPQGSNYQNDPTYISNENEIRRLQGAPPADEIEAEKRRLRILALTEQNEAIQRQAEQGLTASQREASDKIRSLTEQNEAIQRQAEQGLTASQREASDKIRSLTEQNENIARDYARRVQETNRQIEALNRRWKEIEAQTPEQIAGAERARGIRSRAASGATSSPSFDAPYLGEPQRAFLERFRRPKGTAELLAQPPKRQVAPSTTPYGTYSPIERTEMLRSGTWLPYMDYLTSPKLKDVPAGETSLDRLRRYDYLRFYQQANIEQAKQRAQQEANEFLQRQREEQAITEQAAREAQTPAYEQYLAAATSQAFSPYQQMASQYYTPEVQRSMRGLAASFDFGGMQQDYEKARQEMSRWSPMNQPEMYRQAAQKIGEAQSRIQQAQQTMAKSFGEKMRGQQQFQQAQNRIAMAPSTDFQNLLERNRALAAQTQRNNLQSMAARGFYQTPYAYQNV